MPDISLDLQHFEYVSDQKAMVSAWRTFAEVLFTTPAGGEVSFSCIVDSGAPFSVLPFSLWHGRNVEWNLLGKQVARPGGRQTSEPLKWQDVDCSLGDT